MCQDQFNTLDRTAQAFLLWEKGTLIEQRKRDQFQVSIYQLESFFVEIHLHLQSKKIILFKSLSPADLLGQH